MTSESVPIADTVWTREDSDLACSEGWDLFSCEDAEHEPLELERLDDPALDECLGFDEPKFPDDTAAWRHVSLGAAAGNQLHVKALAVLKEVSPKEYENVLKAVLINGSPHWIGVDGNCDRCGQHEPPEGSECPAHRDGVDPT
jgi:hypothetical protein